MKRILLILISLLALTNLAEARRHHRHRCINDHCLWSGHSRHHHRTAVEVPIPPEKPTVVDPWAWVPSSIGWPRAWAQQQGLPNNSKWRL
jgi:hypothetical protein